MHWIGGGLTIDIRRRRLEWSVQPARFRRRLRQTRLAAEGVRLRRVTALAVFLATVSATTAFTGDGARPDRLDDASSQLTARDDNDPALPATPLTIRPAGPQTEIAALAAPQQRATPAPRPQPRIVRPAVDRSNFGQPTWRRYAVAAPPDDGRPLIAIVFDDVGVNRRQAERVIQLPGPMTMSLMSYARDLPNLARKARAAGHELMLHIPMEPHDHRKDPGPNALLTKLDDAELRGRIDWALDRFSGYVGVNNHMGSRFTEDRHGMSIVMQAVARRGLLFLDSKTSGESVAHSTAIQHGVPAASRQVFLDHDAGPGAVRAALTELERIATKNGQAIGIAHPHNATVDVVRAWLTTLEQRGFRLAPISTVVARNYDLG